MSPALADFCTLCLSMGLSTGSSTAMASVHPRVDLVTELVGAVHLQGALGVVRGVHPAGVGVTPRPLQVGAVGERPATGRLEERVDRVDRALGAEHLVAADPQPE